MDVDAWRCVLYGDLYELAPKDFAEPDPSSRSPAPESLKDVKTPPEFKFRRLNPEGYEVTVDLFDLAGRCYPDLIGGGWFTEDGQRAAGENTKALVGLAAGNLNSPLDFTWKGKLQGGRIADLRR